MVKTRKGDTVLSVPQVGVSPFPSLPVPISSFLLNINIQKQMCGLFWQTMLEYKMSLQLQ